MKLSKNFTLLEAYKSSTAESLRLDNKPYYELLPAIYSTAQGMEQVRALLGHNPILVNSWYRSKEVNAKVGGTETSAHLSGYAVDFTCPAFGNPREVFGAIKASFLNYDQLILEFDKWIHISFDPEFRRQSFELNK